MRADDWHGAWHSMLALQDERRQLLLAEWVALDAAGDATRHDAPSRALTGAAAASLGLARVSDVDPESWLAGYGKDALVRALAAIGGIAGSSSPAVLRRLPEEVLRGALVERIAAGWIPPELRFQ